MERLVPITKHPSLAPPPSLVLLSMLFGAKSFDDERRSEAIRDQVIPIAENRLLDVYRRDPYVRFYARVRE